MMSVDNDMRDYNKEVIGTLVECSAKLENIAIEVTNKHIREFTLHLAERVEVILHDEFEMKYEDIEYEVDSKRLKLAQQ